jgi:rSAM/selenodomain-associated transferase 1
VTSVPIDHPVLTITEAYSAFGSHLSDLSSPSPDTVPGLSFTRVRDVDVRSSQPGGSRALRAAIAGLYEHLTPDDILVTSGASEALAALAAALADRSAIYALANGMYPSFTQVAELAGVPLATLESAAQATAVLVTNPTVPDGQRVDLRAALSHAHALGAVLIADEVYRCIPLDGGGSPPAAADLDPLAVSVGDVSKSLGLGGLRIGWIATRNRAVREASARWLRVLTGGPSALSEVAATEALTRFEQHVAQITARARLNAQAVYTELDAAGWSYRPAQLGLTVLAYPPAAPSHEQLEDLPSAGFFLLASESFGLTGGFRVGLLTQPPTLRTALRILAPGHDRGSSAVVLLTRVPRAGFGKTRLAAALGTQAAYSLASAFMLDSLALIQSRAWRRVVAVTPASALPDVRAVVDSETALVPQDDGDLGDRIVCALDHALRRAERAVLIGSDTPDLTPETIQRAFDALDEADVVLGPAVDGGFYLIGVRCTHPDMFRGVEWSTAAVYERTYTNLTALGLRVTAIEAWEDVDDVASLASLAHRLETPRARGRAPATRAALAALAEATVA